MTCMFSTYIQIFHVVHDVSLKNEFKQVQVNKDLQLRCQTRAKYCHGTTEDVDANTFFHTHHQPTYLPFHRRVFNLNVNDNI